MLSRRAVLAAVLAAPALARAAPPVRIGYQKNGSLVILREQRLLEQSGIEATYVEFASGPPLLEALHAGAVDVGATGDTPPIFAQAAGAELVYVGAQPLSGAHEAVLVAAEGPIHAVTDLRGRRVGVTKGSSAHAMLVKVLASAGLGWGDIQPVYLQPPDAAAAFRSGALEAWTIWDPFFAIAQGDPANRVLTTAEGLAPSNSFFLAGRAFAERSPEVILRLLATINAAAAWARANPEPLAGLLSRVTGVPLAAERVAAARGVYAVQPLDERIIATQQDIADTFTRLRIIPRRIAVRDAVWSHPWQAAASR